MMPCLKRKGLCHLDGTATVETWPLNTRNMHYLKRNELYRLDGTTMMEKSPLTIRKLPVPNVRILTKAMTMVMKPTKEETVKTSTKETGLNPDTCRAKSRKLPR